MENSLIAPQVPLNLLQKMVLASSGIQLHACECYAAADIGDKYSKFCEALSLKSPPNLILTQAHVGGIHINGGQGFYHPSSNTIVLPKYVFEAFLKDDPVGDYVMAHELGHAESAQHTRRRILLNGGAIALTSGMILKTPNLVYQRLADQKKLEANEIDREAWVETVAITTMPAILTPRHLFGLIKRAEEFRADDGAVKILGNERVRMGLIRQIERSLKLGGVFTELRGAYTEKLERLALEKQVDLTPAMKERMWAESLIEFAQEENKTTLLSSIIKPNYYPSFEARLNRLLRQEEQQAGLSR